MLYTPPLASVETIGAQMTLPFILPKFVLWLFISNRKTWIYKVRLAPDRAYEIFSNLMIGAGASRTQKAASWLGTRGMKWRTQGTVDGVAAECTGGQPVRIFGRGNTVRIHPEGQVIEFENVSANPPEHRYEMIPANLYTYWGLLAFSGPVRYYYHRTARLLKREGGDIEVTYPISWAKLVLWVLIIVIAISAG